MTTLAAGPALRLFDAAADAAVAQLAPLRGRAVHVNGASGVLAANLIALLSEASRRGDLGLRLYASARRPLDDVALFRFLGLAPDVAWEVASAEETVLPAEPGLIAVHTASFAAPADYLREPLATLRANTDGLLRTWEEAVRAGAGHVVFFSSAEVYGQPPASAMPTSETYAGAPDLADPRSIYAEAKRAGEVLGAVLSAEHGIPFTALRPWNLYGPGQRLGDARVPMAFVRQALADGEVRLTSDGTPRRCPCWVWDGLLQALACLAPGAPERAFNVGSATTEVTMLELARACAVAAGLPAETATAVPDAPARGLARCVPDTARVARRAPAPLPDPTPLGTGLEALRAWVTWSLDHA